MNPMSNYYIITSSLRFLLQYGIFINLIKYLKRETSPLLIIPSDESDIKILNLPNEIKTLHKWNVIKYIYISKMKLWRTWNVVRGVIKCILLNLTKKIFFLSSSCHNTYTESTPYCLTVYCNVIVHEMLKFALHLMSKCSHVFIWNYITCNLHILI